MTVDEYVQMKVLPQYRDLAEAIRQKLRALAPDAEEVVSYGMPCYKQGRILAYFNANKEGVTLSFTYGKRFEDRYALLRGGGKSAQHIKLKGIGNLNDEVLEYYMNQALALDHE
jgi:uncharacterized protein DUF1801